MPLFMRSWFGSFRFLFLNPVCRCFSYAFGQFNAWVEHLVNLEQVILWNLGVLKVCNVENFPGSFGLGMFGFTAQAKLQGILGVDSFEAAVYTLHQYQMLKSKDQSKARMLRMWLSFVHVLLVHRKSVREQASATEAVPLHNVWLGSAMADDDWLWRFLKSFIVQMIWHDVIVHLKRPYLKTTWTCRLGPEEHLQWDATGDFGLLRDPWCWGQRHFLQQQWTTLQRDRFSTCLECHQSGKMTQWKDTRSFLGVFSLSKRHVLKLLRKLQTR